MISLGGTAPPERLSCPGTVTNVLDTLQMIDSSNIEWTYCIIQSVCPLSHTGTPHTLFELSVISSLEVDFGDPCEPSVLEILSSHLTAV